MLATYLDGTSVRLVVLSACETAKDSTQKRFSGIAQRLIRSSSLPAVVAMQFAIPNSSAVAFAEGFYGALADGYPVDAASVEGRKAILTLLGADAAAFAEPDWATPVLFLRSKDGDIFAEELASVSDPGPAREVHGDLVHGDKVMSDHVSGDAISVGEISGGSAVVIGREGRLTVERGLGSDEENQLFSAVYQRIQARPKDPDVDKEELTEMVQLIQQEVSRGTDANVKKVERWLKTLALMAGDVFEISVASLTHPEADAPIAVKQAAKNAQER
jgi:hypothetical protein